MRPQLDVLAKEIGFIFRSLCKERVFTALAITLIAVGIGLASAVFTLLWQAIYAQLPVPEPFRIFTFASNVTHNGRSDSDAMAETISAPMYAFLSSHWKTPTGIIARHGEYVNLETPAGVRHLLADFVTDNYFAVLGVRPIIGRAIQPADGNQGSSALVAVLSYDFWQQVYGGQVTVWNSSIRVNGVAFRIIGVAPAGYNGLIGGQAPQIYVPIQAFASVNPGWAASEDWGVRWLNPFFRLPGTVSAVRAEASLQIAYRDGVRQELAASGPQDPAYLAELSHEHVSVLPASQGVHGVLDQWEQPLQILQCMTMAVLFLVASNVAGLMLVRGIRQRRELLIRYAVGATRTAVLRLQLLESLLLSMVGGAAALWIAHWGANLLVHLARMDRSSAVAITPHGTALAAHWAAVLATGLIIGMIPAWQTARLDLSSGLNEGAPTHSSTGRQVAMRRTLAATQIALSLALAISAGLLADSLHQLLSTPLGFNPQGLTVFSVDTKFRGSTVETTEQLWTRLAETVKSRPNVQSVTYGTGGPFPQGADVAVVIPGMNARARVDHQSGQRSIIGPNYFSTLNIPLVRGREFDNRDRAGASGAVIINEVLAQKVFGSVNPIGQTVTLFDGLGPKWLATIVGVVADHRQSWTRVGLPLIYTPAQQAQRMTDIRYYVRMRDGALPENEIRAIVHEAAPAISPYDISTMQSQLAAFASNDRAMTLLITILALLGLAISATGIYGVVSYSTSLRAVEFSIRISVGATRLAIGALVLKEAALIFCGGILLAAPLTYASVMLIQHQLTATSFAKPAIYASAIGLVLLCVFAATIGPARRAVGTNVQHALRQL